MISPNPLLVAYVQQHVFPCYEGADPAHGLSHIQTVIENSLRIAQTQDVDIDMVYCIAAYHDVGIRFGRETHHLTSASWLEQDEVLPSFFDKNQIHIMKEAIEDHRASSKNPPRSIYGCIIAEADRDLNPYRIYVRSLQFAKARNPGKTEDEIIAISLGHIQEKYGENGYLKLYLFDSKNEAGLAQIRQDIANGDIERKLHEIFAEIA